MEWKLIMKYIANYPVILKNSTKDINDSSIKLNFHSNKVSLYDKDYPNYLVFSQSNKSMPFYYRLHNFWFVKVKILAPTTVGFIYYWYVLSLL